ILQRQRILSEILNDTEIDVPSEVPYTPEQILNLDRVRRLASGKIALASEDTSLRRHQSPIEVYSVTIPSSPPHVTPRLQLSSPGLSYLDLPETIITEERDDD